MACDYIIKIGDQELVFQGIEINQDTNPVDLTSKEKHTLKSLRDSITKGTLKNGNIREALAYFQSHEQIPSTVENLQLDAQIVGITSLHDVISSLNLDNDENELSIVIKKVISKIREKKLDLFKLNVINGNFKKGYSLASKYDPASQCIVLNTNNFVENIYADTLKALIDYYLFNLSPEEQNEIAGKDSKGEQISIETVSQKLAFSTISEDILAAFNRIATKLEIPVDVLTKLNEYQIIKQTLTKSLFDGQNSTVSQALEYFELSKSKIGIYPKPSKKQIGKEQGAIATILNNLKLGDLIYLDIDGQRIKQNGDISTQEEFQKYWENHTIVHENGVPYIFIKYNQDLQQVTLLNPNSKSRHRLILKIDDPRLYWFKNSPYQKKKRIWQDKYNSSEDKFVKFAELNKKALSTKAQSWEPDVKTEKEFKNRFKKHSQNLIPEGFESYEGFDQSIADLLTDGDYFVIGDNNTLCYIKEKRKDCFLVEYVQNKEIITDIIYFSSFTPKIIYFDPNNLFNVDTKNKDNSTVKLDKNNTPIDLQNVNLIAASQIIEIGDVLEYTDKNGILRRNYVVGLNRNMAKPTFKVLVIEKTETPGKYKYSASTVTGNIIRLYKHKDKFHDQYQKILEKEVDNLEKFTHISSFPEYPGDVTKQGEKIWNHIEIVKNAGTVSTASVEAIRNIEPGDIIKLRNKSYMIVTKNLKDRIIGLLYNQAQKTVTYHSVSLDSISDIFTENTNQNFGTLTNGLNTVFVCSEKDKDSFSSNCTFEEVRLFISQDLDRYTFLKSSDFNGSVWSSKEEKEGYRDITQHYIEFINKNRDVDNQIEGKLYRVKRGKTFLTRSAGYNVISRESVDMQNIHNKLTKSMYIAFNDLDNSKQDPLKFRWFRIVEHIQGKGYLLNYSVYNNQGVLESNTFFVTEDFVQNNLFQVKVVEDENWISSKNIIQKPLINCMFDNVTKLETNKVGYIVDSIFNRLGIKCIEVDQDRMEKLAGNKEIKGFVTLSKNGEPIVYINQNTDEIANTKLHELMHLILGTFKLQNPDKYNNLLDTVAKYYKKNFKEDYEKLEKQYIEQYKIQDKLDNYWDIINEEIFVKLFSDKLFQAFLETDGDNVNQILQECLDSFFNVENKPFAKWKDVVKFTMGDILAILRKDIVYVEEIKDKIYDPQKIAQMFKYETIKHKLLDTEEIKKHCE